MGDARLALERSLPVLLLALLIGCSPPPALPKGDTPAVLSVTGTPVAEGQMEEVPPQVAKLARELVAGQSEQRDKALALYDWVAKNVRYDIASYLSNDLPDPSPDVVLASRLAVCEGYARLYMAMAQAVGLEAVLIPGFSKGFAPDEDKIEPDHAWNAVKVDGQWVLLDATWGAGHIDERKQFVAEFSRDWFDVEPARFVATHMPSDPKWQLVSPTLSAEEFWAKPTLSNVYFDYDLSLDSHRQGQITSDGMLKLNFSSGKDCRVMAVLYRDAEPLPGEHTLVERQGRDFTVWVWPPSAGDYRLLIFAGPLDSNRTESAVIYTLRASSGSEGEQFPKTLQTFLDQEVRLIEPRSGLRQGESTQLVVEAPGANKMLAVVEQEQIRFERDGDRFTARITPRGDKVQVYGGYDESRHLDGLLEFPVER